MADKRWRIYNPDTGVDFGTHLGEDEMDALDVWARTQGHYSYACMILVSGDPNSDLCVEPVEVE